MTRLSNRHAENFGCETYVRLMVALNGLYSLEHSTSNIHFVFLTASLSTSIWVYSVTRPHVNLQFQNPLYTHQCTRDSTSHSYLR
jgi:hypothetical protein